MELDIRGLQNELKLLTDAIQYCFNESFQHIYYKENKTDVFVRHYYGEKTIELTKVLLEILLCYKLT